MTDGIQELDVILEDFYDGDIRQSDMGKAKQAILRWVADEVIGADDTGIITDPASVDYGQPYSNVYVDRDEQRKILAEYGYKGGYKNQ